jgi:hypothetical protein
MFVYVVVDINARFDKEKVVRGSFGTANFAAQRVALGSLVDHLSPQEMLTAKLHIDEWERAAGNLIKEVIVFNMHGGVQLHTPRAWLGAIKGLVSKFNECEAGLLSLINAGLTSDRTCIQTNGPCEPPCRADDLHTGKTKCAYKRHFQAYERAKKNNLDGIWSRAGCGLAGLIGKKFV